MTWVNGRIAASVGTADSYVSFPILYLFIFRKTLVAKIRIIFSDQAHSSLKKRYNPQNEMFRLLGTKRSFSQNETFFFSHP